MPFCPVCKNEYREGITQCHECKVPLVASLDEGPKAIVTETEERLTQINDYCKAAGVVSGFIAYEEERSAYSLFFENDEADKAKEAIRNFLMEEELKELADHMDMDVSELTPEVVAKLQKKEAQERLAEQQAERDNNPGPAVYEDKHVKAEEYKSSAYVLLFVGGVGLILLALLYFDIIPGFNSIKSNYMLLGVMGFLFIIFLITGVMSLNKVDQIKALAASEEDLMGRIKKMMEEKLSADQIDHVMNEAADFADLSEEEKYFKREAYMKEQILLEFPQTDHLMIEKLTDERYNEIYENNNY